MRPFNIGDKLVVLDPPDMRVKKGDIVTVSDVGSIGVFAKVEDGTILYLLDREVRLSEKAYAQVTCIHIPDNDTPTLSTPETGDKYETGVKFDNGKPPISLAPSEALLGMAEAFAYGAKKYEKHNYRKGYEWTRALDAAIRHILAELDGEEQDEESGLEHWKHALATIAMYAYFKTNNVGPDDRFKKGA